jgi:site-specific recombinase XerD
MALALALVSHPPVPDGKSAPEPGHVDLDELVEDFLANCSAPTAACYRRDIAHLRCHLAALSKDLLTAGRGDLARWVRSQEDCGVPATTIRRRLSAICGLYSFVVAEGHIPMSPAEGLRRPKGAPAPRLGLSVGELGRLLEVARARGESAELLANLLLVQGLRVREAVGVDDDHLVCHEGRQAVVVMRKGGRVELVGLADDVAEVAERVAAAQGPGPLLRGRGGGRLSRQIAWRWVRRMGEEAGIDAAVFPHLLRHSFISQALLAGVPLPVVSAGAGHRDIRTTLAYSQALAALGSSAGEAVWRRVGIP